MTAGTAPAESAVVRSLTESELARWRTERGERVRERAGRHVRVVCSGVKPERELVSRLEEAGADGCTFYVAPDADAGEAERQLDEFAALT